MFFNLFRLAGVAIHSKRFKIKITKKYFALIVEMLTKVKAYGILWLVRTIHEFMPVNKVTFDV